MDVIIVVLGFCFCDVIIVCIVYETLMYATVVLDEWEEERKRKILEKIGKNA